jgi:hypothetical protein
LPPSPCVNRISAGCSAEYPARICRNAIRAAVHHRRSRGCRNRSALARSSAERTPWMSVSTHSRSIHQTLHSFRPSDNRGRTLTVTRRACARGQAACGRGWRDSSPSAPSSRLISGHVALNDGHPFPSLSA